MKDRQAINQKVLDLVIQRNKIYNSLMSRFSRSNLNWNTRDLALTTGFTLGEVWAVYSADYCEYVAKSKHL